MAVANCRFKRMNMNMDFKRDLFLSFGKAIAEMSCFRHRGELLLGGVEVPRATEGVVSRVCTIEK
jgi:hypothetical protein